MKVRNLIDKLSELDPELEVQCEILDPYGLNKSVLGEVDDVYESQDGHVVIQSFEI